MIELGTKVRVSNNVNKRDYTSEGHSKRVQFTGQTGIVICEHNSHGLCYDVRFLNGTATYDPDELSIAIKTKKFDFVETCNNVKKLQHCLHQIIL